MATAEYVVKTPTLDQKGITKNIGERIIYDLELSRLPPKEFKAMLDKAPNLGPVGKTREFDETQPEGSSHTATPAADPVLVSAAIEAGVLAVLAKMGIAPEMIPATPATTDEVEEEKPVRTTGTDPAKAVDETGAASAEAVAKAAEEAKAREADKEKVEAAAKKAADKK